MRLRSATRDLLLGHNLSASRILARQSCGEILYNGVQRMCRGVLSTSQIFESNANRSYFLPPKNPPNQPDFEGVSGCRSCSCSSCSSSSASSAGVLSLPLLTPVPGMRRAAAGASFFSTAFSIFSTGPRTESGNLLMAEPMTPCDSRAGCDGCLPAARSNSSIGKST